MSLIVQSILLVMAFGYSAAAQNVTDEFDFQLIITKLANIEQMNEQLQTDVKHLQTELKEHGEALDSHHDEMTSNIQELKSEIREHFDALINGSNPDNGGVLKSCTGQTTSGPCRLQVMNVTMDVYYESILYGGGWFVIQNRFNGSVNFFRNWAEYREGFGSVNGEYWLGLENIHLLTSSRPHELLVHLEDFDELQKYARYGRFKIGNEESEYALNELGSYTGTAGDSLSYNKNQMFSTYDRDNDGWEDTNCAQTRQGAWWYDACTFSNLNGRWVISWFWESFDSDVPLRVSKMMVRPL